MDRDLDRQTAAVDPLTVLVPQFVVTPATVPSGGPFELWLSIRNTGSVPVTIRTADSCIGNPSGIYRNGERVPMHVQGSVCAFAVTDRRIEPGHILTRPYAGVAEMVSGGTSPAESGGYTARYRLAPMSIDGQSVTFPELEATFSVSTP